ncbi:MAG: DinB family protein [Anaerolineales bacterium]|nr:DinB family protein [Anaerolineales bacterium]MCB8939138.1 DinB family protein [Ardenticatenaceae bacterium]
MKFVAIFQQNRAYIEQITSTLSDEQMLLMPAGFDNNIAWNLGHLIVVQQSLIYRLCGLPTLTSRMHMLQFSPGTSPANWKNTPDLAEVRQLLTETTAQTIADAAANRFQNYTPYTTTTNFDLPTFEEATVFNLYHEALHFGAIMALRNVVRAG